MKQRVIGLAIAGVLTCAVQAADRTWQAAGDGDWSDAANWTGGVLPGAADNAVFNNALSADAVVNMGDAAVKKLRADTAGSFTRAFTGTGTVENAEFVKGRTELRGTLKATLASTSVPTSVGMTANEAAFLTLADGAVFESTNSHAFWIGNAANALGRVTVKPGARLAPGFLVSNNNAGISVGRVAGAVGSIVQEGGETEAWRLLLGYSGYGAYELLGGTLRLVYGNADTRYCFGVQANGAGLFYQHGGELLVLTNGTYNASCQFEIGRGNNNTRAVYYADGGTAAFDTEIRMQSGGSSATLPSYAELTIDKNAVVDRKGTFHVRMANGAFPLATSAINLNNGGRLRARDIQNGFANPGPKAFNADGGILELSRAGADDVDIAESRNVWAKVWEGGVTFDQPVSGLLAHGLFLRGAKGWGVSELTLADGGSGYFAPPMVTLEGGGGSNATAVAFIDHASGAVTGVVVTCRGEGYAETDTLSAVFAGGGGSGAAATVALAENRTGPLVKTGEKRVVLYSQPEFDGDIVVREGLLLQSTRDGAGAPSVRAVRVSGGEFQNNSGSVGDNTEARWNLVNPQATLALGGAFGGGSALLAGGISNTVFQQRYAALELGFGRNQLTSTSLYATNGAAMSFAALTRSPGAALTVPTSARFSASVTAPPASFAFGAGDPVVPGVSVGNVTELTTPDTDGRLIALTNYTEVFGPDSNVYVTNSVAAGGLAMNSLRFNDTVAVTLADGGTTVVGSGVVVARAGSAGGSKITGGALTSGNGADLILTDFHTTERRNMNNPKPGLIVESRIVDNGTAPVALFALGRLWEAANQSIATGPAVILACDDNAYSGGTYILDTALGLASDGALGPVPEQPTNNIFTSGCALLRAPIGNVTVTLHPNRGIRVCGGVLVFFGSTDEQAGRMLFDVQGPISGRGALVMNHWAGGGAKSGVALSGDNRGFEGQLAVHGLLRILGPHSLPPRAGLMLCDKNNVLAAGGIVEMSGVFDRAPGAGAGQVRWGQANTVYAGLINDNSSAAGGGFAAYGGPLTVNLGGDRRPLTLGADSFSPACLRLQDDYATDTLTWENPVDVSNRVLNVQVANTKTNPVAIWRGAVTSSDPDGGGAFTKIGAGRLVLADGADFGRLPFTANGTLGLHVTNRIDLACDMDGGTLSIEKTGPGTAVMSGTNAYGQTTRVYEGVLVVDGVNTNGGAFTVWPGATLGGSGVVAPMNGAAVTVNGTLAPSGVLTLGSAEQATALALNGTLAAMPGSAVAVYGDVAFGAGATISITVPDEGFWQTACGETFTLLTWTGAKTGTWANAAPLPVGWKVRETPDSLVLGYAPTGTVLTVR